DDTADDTDLAEDADPGCGCATGGGAAAWIVALVLGATRRARRRPTPARAN
ncbi:MAG: MYXO-CTERM sorting domain-containing protein, partial [Phycisphaerales bacterium]